MGLFTLETVKANLVLAPFALIGAWPGVRAHHLVPERPFFRIGYAVLVVTESLLIWGAPG